MKESTFKNILACPKCKTALAKTRLQGTCTTCGFAYKKEGGIWHLLYIDQNHSLDAVAAYDKIHEKPSGRIHDGSYEILAAIARGNKTVDVACGDGFIEQLAPSTVGVEFSLHALQKAQKNGATHLVLASAEHLPFADNAFDVSMCSGSLEHFASPQGAIREMARVSKIQVLVVHRKLSIPGSNGIRKMILKAKGLPDQPIDTPLSAKELERMLIRAHLTVIYKGVWTYPYNLEMITKRLPRLTRFPSCHFVIAIKN